MEGQNEELITLLRVAAQFPDEELNAMLDSLSPASQAELRNALARPPEDTELKFECPHCLKRYSIVFDVLFIFLSSCRLGILRRFKRKWNCTRHIALQHKDVADGAASCAFRDCSASFEKQEDLGEHEEREHGLQKKPKLGVRHDDHYDCLLPSGQLLHLGEDGLEMRYLDDCFGEHEHDDIEEHDCNSVFGSVVMHGNHQDVVTNNNIIHCFDSGQHAKLDVINLQDDTDWKEFLAGDFSDFGNNNHEH